MIAACATMDVYCDATPAGVRNHFVDSMATYTHPERVSACRQQARRAGWKLDDDKTLCPACHRAEKESEK